MTSPHNAGKIPWHCITDHVTLGLYDLVLFGSSQPEARRKAIVHFAHLLANQIISFADGQRHRLPPPGAPPDDWKKVDVLDDSLFPASFVTRTLGGQHFGFFHETDQWEKRKTWEDITSESEDASIMLNRAITEPENPFQYLPSLIYLAQHARVAISTLRSIYTSGNGDPGLDSLFLLSLEGYLFLNILLAIDGGESLSDGRARAMTRWIRMNYDAKYFLLGNHLHSHFWRTTPIGEPRPEQNVEGRAAYSRRCFGILVSYYAIVREAGQRDEAVRRTRPPSFGEEQLVNQILLAMGNISGVFLIARPRFHHSPAPAPTTFSTDFQAFTGHQNSSRKKSAFRPQSRFVHLPEDIHRQIYSHLPPRSLFRLVLVCKQLNAICIPMLYADPLAAGLAPDSLDFSEGHHSRVIGLMALFDSRPNLYSLLRRVRVMEPNLYNARIREIDSGKSLSDGLFPPLQFALEKRIEGLTALTLCLSPECWRCIKDPSTDVSSLCVKQATEAVVRVADRWPSLEVFKLETHGVEGIHHEDDSAEAPIIFDRMPNKVRFLDVSSWVAPLGYASLQLALMTCSAHSLRRLSLTTFSMPRQAFNALTLPIFPNATDVNISSNLSGEKLETLLQRCFPSVISLSVQYYGHISDQDTEFAINFSACAPNMVNLRLDASLMARVPDSLRTVSINETSGVSIRLAESRYIEAIQIEGLTNTTEYLTGFGRLFNGLRSLEVWLSWSRIQEAELPIIAETIAAEIPQLEILILHVDSLTDRPCRCDFPSDDGIDQIQHQHAVIFFSLCSNLRVVSFNGVPQPWDTPGSVPGRVWARMGGPEARMVGRAEIPWKLGEFWVGRD